MLEFVISSAIILLSLFLYKFMIIPKRKMQTYKRQFEKQGYRVKVIPFGFMGMPIFQQMMKDAKTDDFMKLVKEEYPSKDIVIFNLINKVSLDIIHPELIKEYFTQESTYIYPKNQEFIEPMKRIIRSGLVFSEGDIWKKKKRKLLNRIFNFDMIKGFTKQVTEICENSLTEV